MSDEQGVSKVVDLMRSTRIAMLTTSDDQGRLTSRPMATTGRRVLRRRLVHH